MGLSKKAQEVADYVECCVTWAAEYRKIWDAEQALRHDEPDDLSLILRDLTLPEIDIADDVREDKRIIIAKLTRRRAYVADLIRQSRLTPKQKKIMTYRYIKCWGWRRISMLLKCTKRWVYIQRVESLEKMVRVFDSVVGDDYKKDR